MSTVPAETAQGLYAAHRKIYSREVSGRHARLRVAAVVGLLGLFYGVPWLRWDGRQAVLFDLPARHFRLWGVTFFPQDFILLTLLLVIAALALFFFTALAGRLWCGYACPQTVWTEVYVWMERWTEGGSRRQARLDRGGWSAEKILRKSAKQAAWIAFSFLTGLTFVGYFSPIGPLVGRAATLGLRSWELFWVVFYSFATYGKCRLPARAGVQVHVPLRPLPERDVRPAHVDHLVRRGSGRAARRDAPCGSRPPRRLHRLHLVRAGPVPRASTSGRGCNTSASPAPPASTPATA